MRLLPTGLVLCLMPLTIVRADENPDRCVATVLGKDVLQKSVTPDSAEVKRRELTPAEYAKWLLEYRANLLRSRVVLPILQDHEKGTTLSPTDEELNELIAKIAKEHAGDLGDGTEEERRRFALRVFWLKGVSKEWRTARALHAKYGGRVGISSFGACTAIDAQLKVLKDYAARGELTIHDRDLEAAFWKLMSGAPNTDVVLRPERVVQHFEMPPWERFRQQLVREAVERSEKP